jgi:hypothetical protein
MGCAGSGAAKQPSAISALLVVNDVTASPPPRAFISPRKPYVRGLLHSHHGLLAYKPHSGSQRASLTASELHEIGGVHIVDDVVGIEMICDV